MAILVWPFLPINTLLGFQNTTVSSVASSSRFSTLKGIVTDSAGRPLANATIVISTKAPFSEITARTTANGHFSTDSLTIGETFTVSILLLGFRPFESKEFTVSSTKELSMNFVMIPREVVVRSVNKRSIPATVPRPQNATAK